MFIERLHTHVRQLRRFFKFPLKLSINAHQFSTMATFAENTFKIDRFRCVQIRLAELLTVQDLDPSLFESHMQDSVKYWKEQRLRGVWCYVPLEKSEYIPSLVKNKFVFHHAKPGYVAMMNWISEEEPSNVPSYPFTNIGVGGLVVDDENNVLVIQEKYSPVAKKLWKFPGGHADKGENFYTTAEREVLEETGVKTKFESVIVFRHLHKFQFDASDIYIVCSLKPTDKTDVAECVHEIEAVKWLPMEEALKELSGFNQYVLRKYLLFKEKGIKISVDEIDHILGGKTPVYTLQLDSNSSL